MKDKMKKILFLVLSLILLGGANSVKAIVLGDEITSLAGITDGTMFIISDDGTKAKYFWGNGTTSGENENKNANIGEIPADAYFYFSLEKYTGNDIPNTTSPADNIYRIKITNADGDGYPYGSNGCYLNAVLNYASVVISGTKDGWGSDAKDALWYVTYDEEKGFSFQNVYRSVNSLSSWLAIGKNFESDQQYLKLYSKPVDPLATEKAALTAKINRARMYHALAYTDASFSALTGEITTAEAALAAAASAESLTTATDNLQTKIDALVFKEGFQNLTADMFKAWNKADAADAVTTGTATCNYILFTATDLPYGESGVGYLHYADLSSYTTLYVIATEKRPRFMMNRDVNEGQWNANEGDSHLIDNTKGGWSAKYFSNEGSVYSVNLALLAEEKGFAHLNTIKVEGWQATDIIKGMYLYRTPDPLQSEKDDLLAEINRGKNVNTFARTAASVTALSDAISAGETELSNKAATAESLVAAKNAITAAIAGLKLQDGYTNLTKEMANDNVDYVLNSSTGQAYGTGGVDMNTYAELNEFDQFVVLASVGKPRFCMNRLTANGQIGADLESSNMIDINTQGDYAGYTWATTKYQTIDGNKYTLDLKKIAEDWNGLARLHAIKGANYNNVTVTDMLLYRTVTVGETGYATFGSLNKSAKLNGVTAYAAKYEGGVVTLAPVTNVPAGKGVVVKAGAGSFAPTFDVEASDIDSDLKVSNGTVTGDGSTIYVLNKVADTVGFYLLKAGNTLEAGKAYLKIDDPSGARSFVGIRGLDATGISTVQDSPKTDDVYYNLNGQRVSRVKKGLYIRNGKKAYVD